jgi:hypothetical protein
VLRRVAWCGLLVWGLVVHALEDAEHVRCLRVVGLGASLKGRCGVKCGNIKSTVQRTGRAVVSHLRWAREGLYTAGVSRHVGRLPKVAWLLSACLHVAAVSEPVYETLCLSCSPWGLAALSPAEAGCGRAGHRPMGWLHVFRANLNSSARLACSCAQIPSGCTM